MFIIGGLLTVKVLQSRHPKINANAFVAFFCFAVVILLTMIGIVSISIHLSITLILRYSLPVWIKASSYSYQNRLAHSGHDIRSDILHVILLLSQLESKTIVR